jgi:hypothetical protein
MLSCATPGEHVVCYCMKQEADYEFSQEATVHMTEFQNSAKEKCLKLLEDWTTTLKPRGMQVSLGVNFQWIQFEYDVDMVKGPKKDDEEE